LKLQDTIPADVLPLLTHARQVARDAGASGDALARAYEIAEIVAPLTHDGTLVTAVIAHETLPVAALSMPATAAAIGHEAISLTHALSQLGELTLTSAAIAGRDLAPAQAETLRKMLLSVVSDPRLVIARLARQLVDLRHAKTAHRDARESLAQATRAVFAPLADRLGLWQLKWELEDLAFRYLQPEDYKRIAAALAETRAEREQYIVTLVRELADALAATGIDAEVYGRPKHIYSIWRKMQRKQLAFEQLFDVRALRIVVESVADCYAALGVVHGRYPYLPGEFDDYIATPKDNFYRSIHTAVIGPQALAVEVQIRTREMHGEAELGLAAHWRYKEGSARDESYDRKIAWVRRLLEPTGGETAATADRDFIEDVRSELFEDRVYALTPKGEVVDLPRGATPLDFAYQVHTNLGHRCRGARVNGRIVPLTRALANGEVVDIITGKQPQPSRDWLAADQGFLASPRSRAKVRAWFRKLDESDNKAAGRAMLDRELTRLGAGNELISALITELKTPDIDRLCVLLGEGEISVRQLAQAIERLQAPRRVRPAPKRRPGKTRTPSSPITLVGVDDLPLTLARCCAPVRPQPVMGYVTLGRGVTVHRADCPGLLRMLADRPERALQATWSASDGAISIGLSIRARDRRGLVRDLSDVLANAKLSIEAMQTTTDAAAGTAHITVRLGVADMAQLDRISALLARVPGVTQVRRNS
jgi:GTP pyrophosphokinase